MGKRLTDSFHCEKNYICSTKPRWYSFVAIDVTNTIAARFLSVYELKREETEVLSLVDKNL